MVGVVLEYCMFRRRAPACCESAFDEECDALFLAAWAHARLFVTVLNLRFLEASSGSHSWLSREFPPRCAAGAFECWEWYAPSSPLRGTRQLVCDGVEAYGRAVL